LLNVSGDFLRRERVIVVWLFTSPKRFDIFPRESNELGTVFQHF
jgi:hypothetical protein